MHDGFVYGVQSSGVIKWKYPAGGPVVSTAAIGNPIGSDTTLFMGGSDGTLHAVSANYGTSKWSYIRPQLHLNGKWRMRAKRPIVSSAALAPEGIVYYRRGHRALRSQRRHGQRRVQRHRQVGVRDPRAHHGFSGAGQGRPHLRRLYGRIALRPPTIRRRIHLAIRRRGRALLQPCAGRRGTSVRWERGFVPVRAGQRHGSPGVEIQSLCRHLLVPSHLPGRTRGWRARLRRMHGLETVRGATAGRSVGVESDASSRAPGGGATAPAPPAPPSQPPTPGRLRPPTDPRRRRLRPPATSSPGEGAKAPYVLADERARREAETILEAEGVCPPNLAQGTSEEAAFRFGWNPVLSCGGDTGATGVVASPVYSPNGLVYVGSTDSYFYAVENRTGAVRWAMFADGPVQSSAAVDEDGKLFFATDAGTIYQIADPPEGG